MVGSTEVKEALGERARDIIARGLHFKEVRGKVNCPAHNDKHPSMSWYKDGLMWRCHVCGAKIDIYEYYTVHEGMQFRDAVKEAAREAGVRVQDTNRIEQPRFALPRVKLLELSEHALAYMKNRCITPETLKAWKVAQTIKNGRDVFCFLYATAIGEKLEYVSYREIAVNGDKGGCEANTKAILWGMWMVDVNKPLIITEGQLDAMSIWQAGHKNVVSIPAGCKNEKWITNCWEWLKQIKEFIIFADNDKPGIEFAKSMQVRLPNVKIVVADGYKDANDCLMAGKPLLIHELIEKAEGEAPEGIIEMSRVEYKSILEMEAGSVESGFLDLDKRLNDFKMGEVTVLFGRDGEGKTTFISQMIAHLLEQDESVFLFSGEMSKQKIQEWIYRQMVGRNRDYLETVKGKYGEKLEPKNEIIKIIKQWHRDRFFLYDLNSKGANEKGYIFDRMLLCLQKYGVKMFFIDNLMTAIYESADSLFSDQANFVQDCRNFADANNVHIILLAHPNKVKGEIKEEECNLEKGDISGSKNIGNKAANIIAIERVWCEPRTVDAFITCLKNRETGSRFRIGYKFSTETLRFYNSNTSETFRYGWERMLAHKQIEEQEEFNFAGIQFED